MLSLLDQYLYNNPRQHTYCMLPDNEYVVPKLGICPILRLGKLNLEFQVWVPIFRLGKPNLESAMLPNLKIGQLHNLKIDLPKLGILND